MLPAGLLLTTLLFCADGALQDRRLESASLETEVTASLRFPDDEVGVQKRSSSSPAVSFIVKTGNAQNGANTPNYSSFIRDHLRSSQTKTQKTSKFWASGLLNEPMESQVDVENSIVHSGVNNFRAITYEPKEENLEATVNRSQDFHEFVDQNSRTDFGKGSFLPYSLLTIPRTVLQYLISIKRDNRNKSNATTHFANQETQVNKSVELNVLTNITAFPQSFTLETLTKMNELLPSWNKFETDLPIAEGNLHNLTNNLGNNLHADGKDTDRSVDLHRKLFSDLPSSLLSSLEDSTHRMIFTNSSANHSNISSSQALPIFTGEKSLETTISFQTNNPTLFDYFYDPETMTEGTTKNPEDQKENNIDLQDPYDAVNFDIFLNDPVEEDSVFENIPADSNINKGTSMHSSITSGIKNFTSASVKFIDLSDREVKGIVNPLVQIDYGNTFYSSITDTVLPYPNILGEFDEDTNSSVILDTNFESLPGSSSFSETNKRSKSGTSMSVNAQSARSFFSKGRNESPSDTFEFERPHRKRTFKTSPGATQPPAERTTRRQRRTMYVVVVEERPCEGVCCKREHYTGRCRLALGCALLRFHSSTVRKLSCGTNFQATFGGGPSLEPPPARPLSSTGDRTSYESGERVTQELDDSLSDFNHNFEKPRTVFLQSDNAFDNHRYDIQRTVHLPSANSSVNRLVIPRNVDIPFTGSPFETTSHESLPDTKIVNHAAINSSFNFNIAKTSVAGVLDNRKFSETLSSSTTVSPFTVNVPRGAAVNELKSTLLNATLHEVTTDGGLDDLTSSYFDVAAASVEELERKTTQTGITTEGLLQSSGSMVTEIFENTLKSSYNVTTIVPEDKVFVTFFITYSNQQTDNSTEKLHPSSTNDNLNFITRTSFENKTTDTIFKTQGNVYATNNSDLNDYANPTVVHSMETNLSNIAYPTTEVPYNNDESSIMDNSYSQNKMYVTFATSCCEKSINDTSSETNVPYTARRDSDALNTPSTVNEISESTNETLYPVDAKVVSDVTSSSPDSASAPPALSREDEDENEEDAGEWDSYITDELSIDYNYEEYTTDPEYDYYYYDEPHEPATQHVIYTDQVWISEAGGPGPLELHEMESVALGHNRGRMEDIDAEWINEDNRRHPHLVMSSHALKQRRK
ncbi:hypothetical protein FHG87_001074 [Trinorchestia longiramus]|nr:hypothetical protein FHG87_001074 [Trinorchestia longiramus]